MSLRKPQATIHVRELIRLSLAHMNRKKARTAVTIGGMAIGVGAIVFLVSVGYGLQDLVINRVARLEELRQIHVSTQQGSQVVLNDESLATFREVAGVEQVLPLISVVGRVSYENSTSDVAAFGVTNSYLRSSALQPTQGRLFESDALTVQSDEESEASEDSAGEVQGIFDDRRDDIAAAEQTDEIRFSIQPDEWLIVRATPDRTASVLGYTKRLPGGQQTGTLVEGSRYTALDSGQSETRWVSAQVSLWTKTECASAAEGCEEEYTELMDDGVTGQKRVGGYFGLNFVTIDEHVAVKEVSRKPQVLGIISDVHAAEEEEPTATPRPSTGTLKLVEIEGESDAALEAQVEQIAITSKGPREAVVNRQFLQVLGITENEAIDKTFNVSFVVVSSLLTDATKKVESVSAPYTIVGILPEEEAPAIYVPFVDIRSLGIASYSQVKLIATKQDVVPDIRRIIEAMGYTTASVLDTVEQITSFFGTARLVLGVVGSVALVIAALGMFNTLTVSLLERTHEVGLMKAIGMKSREVQKLFLVESLTMGFLGGIFGLALGYLAGWILSLVLTSVALARGAGTLSVVSVPPLLIVGVVVLAVSVGVVTGLYPARRATKISPLDALRYE